MRLLVVARLVGVASLLTVEVAAAARPVSVLGQLDTEPVPRLASDTRTIRVSLDADARAPLSRLAVARYIRPSLDGGAWPLASETSVPLPKRRIRVDLSSTPAQIATPLPARRLRLQLD
jgi:hypothetical protein